MMFFQRLFGRTDYIADLEDRVSDQDATLESLLEENSSLREDLEMERAITESLAVNASKWEALYKETQREWGLSREIQTESSEKLKAKAADLHSGRA